MPRGEPRIPFIKRSEWTDEARDVFAVLGGPESRENGPSKNIVYVFARHPALALPFLAYNRHLLMNSSLPDRVRELVTLYIGWTCKSDYEWLSHVASGLRLGLTGDDIEAVKHGPDSLHWSELERTLLRAVDQMREAYNLDDELWALLSKEFDHRQMMDLLFTIGNYIMLAAVLNAVRVPPEAELAEIERKYGSP
jgi:alkylhydroperoxidase family enzyme